MPIKPRPRFSFDGGGFAAIIPIYPVNEALLAVAMISHNFSVGYLMDHLDKPIRYVDSDIYRDGGSIGLFCKNAADEIIEIYFKVLHRKKFGRIGLHKPKIKWLNESTFEKYISEPLDWDLALELLNEINGNGTHWDYAYEWTKKQSISEGR